MRIARNARSRRHRDGTFGQHQLDAQTHDPLKDLTPPGAQMSCRHPAFSVRVPLFYDRRSKLRGVDAVEYRVVEATLPNGALVLVRAADVDGGTGATKTSWTDRFDFSQIADALDGLSSVIKSGLAAAAPDKEAYSRTACR
jgi:hypothetical protein